MARWLQSLVLISLIFAVPLALAEGLNGPEFTFTNAQLIEAARAADFTSFRMLVSKDLRGLYKEMRRRCSECSFSKIIRTSGGCLKFKVLLPTGVRLFVHADDWVIEAGMSPVTLSQIKNNEALIDRSLFEAAATAGLRPDDRIGGGHQHFDLVSYFGGDALLFRNFIVDLANRPELFLGGLSLDLLNAPPLAILKPEQVDAFAAVIANFDRHPTSIAKLKRAINEQVYRKTFVQSDAKDDEMVSFRANPAKYHAVNFLHEETVELRGLPPPRSMGDFYARAKLFSRRIDQLKKLNRPLPFRPQYLRGSVRWSTHRRVEHYRVGLSDRQVTRALDNYIAAAGLNVKEWRSRLLAPGLHRCENELSSAIGGI